MPMSEPVPHAPIWLRALGACVLAVMAGALVYAVTIALANLSRIGV
jgi:hypothetical protein